MSYSIILVDDESVDLKWMKERVQNFDLPLHVVSAVKSGFAALDLLEHEQIDIILSDIRMPIMSGMEFARKAKEINPHVKIVFISGMQDFDHALEAIHMGASGYLLKPVDDDELFRMLLDLCKQFEQERNQQRSVTEALSLVNYELLLRWLNEFVPSTVDDHIKDFLSPLLMKGCAVALIEIDDLDWKIGEETERRTHYKYISEYIESYVVEFFLGIVFSDNRSRFVVLSTVPESQFTELLQSLISAVERSFATTITVGMGDYAHSIDRLHVSYRKAQAALGAKWLLGKNRLHRESVKSMSRETAESNFNRTAEKLLQAILVYDLVIIDDCLSELFERSFSMSSRRNDAYDLIIRLTSKLHADLLPMNENLYEILRWESHQPGRLFEFETLDDILSWLRKRFFELSELLFSKRHNQKRKLIEQMITYVEERNDYMLTLKEVAAHFDFTPNYLGQLFKEETGIKFSDFIHDRRMKRVCDLLNDPSMKIYEVANRTGFKNMIYFNRQFKQSFGMTPSEYRRKHNI